MGPSRRACMTRLRASEPSIGVVVALLVGSRGRRGGRGGGELVLDALGGRLTERAEHRAWPDEGTDDGAGDDPSEGGDDRLDQADGHGETTHHEHVDHPPDEAQRLQTGTAWSATLRPKAPGLWGARRAGGWPARAGRWAAGGRPGARVRTGGRAVPTTSSRSAAAPRATAPTTPSPSGVHTSPEKPPAVVTASLAALLARPLALLASSVALEAMAFSSMADRSTPAEESACGAWAGGGGCAGARPPSEHGREACAACVGGAWRLWASLVRRARAVRRAAPRSRGSVRLHERCGRFGQLAEKGGGVELGQLDRGEVDLGHLGHLDRGEVGRREAARLELEGGGGLHRQRVGRQRGGEARQVGRIRQLKAGEVGGIRQLKAGEVGGIGQLEAGEVGGIGQLEAGEVGHLEAGEVRCLGRASDRFGGLEGEALRPGQA